MPLKPILLKLTLLASSVATVHAAISAAIPAVTKVASPTTLAAANTIHESTRLPDGEISHFGWYSAWLTKPTRRYRHAVLGDDIEAGGFEIQTPQGKRLQYGLDTQAVFEDRRVRLVDLTGDGIPEAVIIKSTQRQGAALAIYRIAGDKISPLAEGPPIGRPYRWLNVAGIADFNGDGQTDIAYVQTPHLAGIVRIFTLAGNALVEIGQLSGYSNHVIGSPDLDLATARDIDGDGAAELIVPVIGDAATAILGMRGGKLVELGRHRH